MINPLYKKMAKLAINYSLMVKKGERVFIIGPIIAQELFRALQVETLKAGGYPFLCPQIEGSTELLFKYGTEEQITYVDDIIIQVFKDFDCYIQIFGDYNTRKYSLVDPEIMGKFQGSKGQQEIYKIMNEREKQGEFRWLIVPYACQAYAQEANMDLFSFTELIIKTLLLDKEEPVKEWSEIKKKQDEIVAFLNKAENIEVFGEDTNLSFSTRGRKWGNYCGEKNLPDGEVATSPIEDSVNGKIRFTYPGIYSGQEIENIYLEFINGKVSKATASKGENLLKEILKIENADIVGEFAIGTNYGVTKFVKNILFDEKMGGTLHLALGLGIPECGSKNISAIHWDILKDMKVSGSRILADGKVFYEEGKWKI